MANEILAVKLCELDEKLGRLHGRIILSQSFDRKNLKHEIERLENEFEEAEIALRQKLKFSKNGCVAALSKAYQDMESIASCTREELKLRAGESGDADISAEEQILLAEYALDFAVQAADRALILALQAVETQKENCEKGENH